MWETTVRITRRKSNNGGRKEKKQTTHRGSTISNNNGSVTRSHTSYAFVFLNSDIQSMLKSWIAFGLPGWGVDE